MARTLYGGTPAHVLADEALDGTLRVETTAGLTVWTAETGGTQETDLLDKSSNPITTVTPTDKGRVWFYGKDGVSASYWIQDSDGDRWRMDPAPSAFGVASWNGSTGPVTYTEPTWSTITGKPAVIGAGTTTATARAAIGAFGAPDVNVPGGIVGIDPVTGLIDPTFLGDALDLAGYAQLTDLGVQVEAIATGDDSNLAAALASVSSTLGVNGFIAVKVAGS